KLASSGADATARQPEAANDIRSTINLPLFLLEGVAIIGLVVCILAVFL
ncbi:MAG: F0F1 ATP synthase subunit C, partial [FCB group bacterium]|nr:F0F1 ATP synthase subunit C [FCB group bacterium]